MGKAYYESGKRGAGTEQISQAGLIQEAACEYSATYDLLVLAEVSEDLELQKAFSKRGREVNGATGKLRRIISRAIRARKRQDERAFRIALADFGREVSETKKEERLYTLLRKSIEESDSKREETALGKISAEIFGSPVFSGHSVYDLISAKLLHFSDYQNEGVERSVGELHRLFSPSPKDVARGRSKSPFIDLIGLHASVDEIGETADIFREYMRGSPEKIEAELRKTCSYAFRKGTTAEYRFSALRKIYALAEAGRRAGLDVGPCLEPLGHVTKGEGTFEANRLLAIYS